MRTLSFVSLVRLSPQINSGGAAGQCEGALEVDLNEYVRSNGGSLTGQSVFAGTTVRAQASYRDPPALLGSNLSDALALTSYL